MQEKTARSSLYYSPMMINFREKGENQGNKGGYAYFKNGVHIFRLSHFKHQQPCMPGTQHNRFCLDIRAS
jgi:hypothetical protein